MKKKTVWIVSTLWSSFDDAPSVQTTVCESEDIARKEFQRVVGQEKTDGEGFVNGKLREDFSLEEDENSFEVWFSKNYRKSFTHIVMCQVSVREDQQ